MRLATFQPVKRDFDSHTFRAKRVMADLLGYNPVFCFPAETAEQFVFGGWFSMYSQPETLVSVDTGDYKAFDLVRWNRLIFTTDRISPDDIAGCFENVDPKYAEFVISEDILDCSPDVVNTLVLSNLPDSLKHGFGTCADALDEEEKEDFVGFLDNVRLNAADSVRDEKGRRVTDKDVLMTAVANAYINYTGYIVYRMSFDEPLRYPFDGFPCTPIADFFPQMEDTRIEMDSLMESMYCDAENFFTYENFDELCRLMARMLSARAEAVMKCVDSGRNGFCPCGSGKKFKKCHGGVINVRPLHI